MSSKMSQLALAISALMLGNGAALAVTDTADLSVTATVSTTCIISNGTLAFGSYDPLSASPTDGDSGSTVTVQCTNLQTYQIYSTTALADRKMVADGGGTARELTYKLYASSANRSAGTELPVTKTTGTLAGTGTGLLQYVTIYGRIAAGQNVYPGSYSGTANLTLDY